jgi:tetratricopeptide (TPR) repeat protein
MRHSLFGRVVLVAVLAAVGVLRPASLAAQKKGDPSRPPARPRMEASHDTNSAADYYYHGVRLLTREPKEAAAAFYWAARLDPLWAEPLYARRVAMYVSQVDGFRNYARASRSGKRSSTEQLMDSLHYQALLRNPFLYRGLDRAVFAAMIAQEERRSGRVLMVRGRDIEDPEYSAWMAYTEANFRDALKWNAIAIKRFPKAREQLHAERARLHYHLAQHDSAIAELDQSLAAMRKQEAKKIVVLYESKAMYEYGVARVHAQLGRLPEAREAYGRALSEDLSFHMAHAGLGDVAFAQQDTATAIAEYALATELQPDDAAVRFRYGALLMNAGQVERAASQFSLVALGAPEFAAPRLQLARLYEAVGQRTEAADYYREFLSLASGRDPDAASARERVRALATATTAVAP